MNYVKTPRENTTSIERIDLDGMTVSQAEKFFADRANINLNSRISVSLDVGSQAAFLLITDFPETDAQMERRHNFESYWFDVEQAKEKREYLRLKAIFETAS